jgi:hypothetical protein
MRSRHAKQQELSMRDDYFHTGIPKRIGLVVFWLLVILFIVSPVFAAEQSNTPFSTSVYAQDISLNPSTDGSKQTIFKASASSVTADFTYNVGQLLTIWAHPPNPVALIHFQRSEDGVNWCDYRTAAPGSDGTAYVHDYTETCPGIAYYRSITNDGQVSNVFSINWLQSSPPLTCVPIPECVQKSYSITCIENYDHMDAIGSSIQECDNLDARLRSAGYTQNFYNKDGDVIAENFGTDPSYNGHKLTESAFHYHSGHGTDVLHLGMYTYLPLKNYDEVWIVPPPPAAPIPVPVRTGGYIDASMVERKWGDNTKWVMLDSCNALRDNNWEKSLTTSHGILGYTSDSWVRTNIGDVFFSYAIDQKMTIVDAYKSSTIELYQNDNITAKVITKTIDHMENDQFPGVGYMGDDGDPDSRERQYLNWNCRSGVTW